ncbi:unnamed protein product [Ixodes persulcatus]
MSSSSCLGERLAAMSFRWVSLDASGTAEAKNVETLFEQSLTFETGPLQRATRETALEGREEAPMLCFERRRSDAANQFGAKSVPSLRLSSSRVFTMITWLNQSRTANAPRSCARKRNKYIRVQTL